MNKKNKRYLYSITTPLTKRGVNIIEENNGNEKLYAIIPRDMYDYGALVGENGTHAEAIRTMMRTWSGVHTDSRLRINVVIVNPYKIKNQYV
jgi:predicted RNA-binding protein YlqC (UPF0109 family)